MPATKQQQEIWIPRADALAASSLSERQFQRYLADGRIRRKVLPRGPGEPGDHVYVHAADLARVEQARKQGIAIPLPPATAVATRTPSALAAAAAAPESDEEEQADSYTPEPRRRPRQWMTIGEAARWSGLSARYLREACEVGAIRAIDQSFRPGRRRRQWRICRDSIGGARDLRSFSAFEPQEDRPLPES